LYYHDVTSGEGLFYITHFDGLLAVRCIYLPGSTLLWKYRNLRNCFESSAHFDEVSKLEEEETDSISGLPTQPNPHIATQLAPRLLVWLSLACLVDNHTSSGGV